MAEKENQHQCLVIGAGPAGLTAALFLGRARVKTLVVGNPGKSDLVYGRVIGNYFGFPDEPPGKTLLDNGIAQIQKYGVEIIREEVVDAEKKENGIFRVVTETKKEFESETVIIATGQAYVRAGLQNEEKFLGKGVHICVACDGVFFRDKKVGVIGAGSHAAQEAIELSTYTNLVTVFTQGDDPLWSGELGRLLQEKGIAVRRERVRELRGDNLVTGITIADGREEPMDGVFVALGSASSVTFAYKLGLGQKDGFLSIDRDGKTGVEGVWAAGGCAGGNPQIAKSAGEGCNAAISVIKKVKGLAQYYDQT